MSFGGVVKNGWVMSSTVSVTVLWVMFPAASVAVTVTLVAPLVSGVPTAGDWLSVTPPVQLSAVKTPAVKSGMRTWHEASAFRVVPDGGFVKVGGVVSTTVTVRVTWVALLFAGSLTS